MAKGSSGQTISVVRPRSLSVKLNMKTREYLYRSAVVNMLSLDKRSERMYM